MKKLIFIEFPEFEGHFIDESLKILKIYNIESEKPLVRFNNLIFQGKWVFIPYSKFVLYIKNKKLRNKNNLIKLIRHSYIKKNFLKINKKILFLYRIPLTIKKKLR